MGHHKFAPLKSNDWSLIVLDTLHGLLRISDVIFGSLYEWARRSYNPSDKQGLLLVRADEALFIRHLKHSDFRWRLPSLKGSAAVPNRSLKSSETLRMTF
jgi:hypothetical protein